MTDDEQLDHEVVLALAIVCPQVGCAADVDQPCRHLRTREILPVTEVHSVRIRAAQRAI